MPGNVREWCRNETPAGRVIRGGAWDDNPYAFGTLAQAPPMDRSPKNGLRLALYPDPDAIPAEAVPLAQARDVYTETPVPEAIFRVYKEQFAYDATDLNARVEYRGESPGGWIREKISFDAVYGGERIMAHLFLPASAPPPYQTVIYFPGSASTWVGSSEDIESYYEFPMFLSFLVTSGRAVLYPVYKGTFERMDPALTAIHGGNGSRAYAEYLVQLVKDFKRSVDYLETRLDIDSQRLAYYGMSWGGKLGAIIPALDEQITVSVLLGGYSSYNPARQARPEADDFTYVGRVKVPTLMLNGKYDVHLDHGIKPMFDLLGTPPEHKRLILYDTDHIPPRVEYVKETLAWLDKYLGPVGR
jgi:eukaryotic-like serine/threonine-protein kinase